MSCKTCKFSERGISSDEDDLTLECHRFPPSIGPRRSYATYGGTGPDAVTWHFPMVHEQDWCGEEVEDPGHRYG